MGSKAPRCGLMIAANTNKPRNPETPKSTVPFTTPSKKRSMSDSTTPSTEDQALQLLATLDWKLSGRHLTANWEFDSPATVALRNDLGRNTIAALGLEILGCKAYLNPDAERFFEIEGMPLKICKSVIATNTLTPRPR